MSFDSQTKFQHEAAFEYKCHIIFFSTPLLILVFCLCVSGFPGWFIPTASQRRVGWQAGGVHGHNGSVIFQRNAVFVNICLADSEQPAAHQPCSVAGLIMTLIKKHQWVGVAFLDELDHYGNSCTACRMFSDFFLKIPLFISCRSFCTYNNAVYQDQFLYFCFMPGGWIGIGALTFICIPSASLSKIQLWQTVVDAQRQRINERMLTHRRRQKRTIESTFISNPPCFSTDEDLWQKQGWLFGPERLGQVHFKYAI